MKASLKSLCSFCLLIQVVYGQTCFNSTRALLEAQAFDTRPNDQVKIYTFCEDLEILVGIPNNNLLSNYSNGDFPLIILKPNTVIEGNGVVLKGGSLQLVTFPWFAFRDDLNFSDPKDNVVVNDITFEGPIKTLPALQAYGISLTGPGSNMQ